ncbi:MAG: ABC transporter permease [Verrucomicrobia bacterium]|nr:ABC transporter permease [Verrucomicrobiota bacterium]
MKRLHKIWSIPEVGLLVPLILFTIVFYWLNASFLGSNSVAAMLRAMAFVGVIAVGQTWLMIAGGIDLSVGSVAGLCAVVSSWLMKAHGWQVEAGIAAGVCIGMLAGLINGVISVRLGIPAFIATLGMLYIARGFNYLLCQGYPIYPIPEPLKNFGRAEPLGLSWAFVVFALLVIVGDFFLRRTIYGRMVYATGGNVEVARIAGINTNGVQIGCYVLTGAMSALAGMLLMAQLNVGQPEIGVGWELDVIASVVIGGVSLFGGAGTVTGTFLGLLIMQVVRSGLVVSGVNTHWQTVAVGVIMVAAVGVDLLRRKTKESLS